MEHRRSYFDVLINGADAKEIGLKVPIETGRQTLRAALRRTKLTRFFAGVGRAWPELPGAVENLASMLLKDVCGVDGRPLLDHCLVQAVCSIDKEASPLERTNIQLLHVFLAGLLRHVPVVGEAEVRHKDDVVWDPRASRLEDWLAEHRPARVSYPPHGPAWVARVSPDRIRAAVWRQITTKRLDEKLGAAGIELLFLPQSD